MVISTLACSFERLLIFLMTTSALLLFKVNETQELHFASTTEPPAVWLWEIAGFNIRANIKPTQNADTLKQTLEFIPSVFKVNLFNLQKIFY
jgi:hypothetical protein